MFLFHILYLSNNSIPILCPTFKSLHLTSIFVTNVLTEYFTERCLLSLHFCGVSTPRKFWSIHHIWAFCFLTIHWIFTPTNDFINSDSLESRQPRDDPARIKFLYHFIKIRWMYCRSSTSIFKWIIKWIKVRIVNCMMNNFY
jgi:hypothetical protein